MTPPRTGTSEVATLGPSGTGALLGVGFAVEGEGDSAGAELLAGAEDGDVAGAELAGVPVSPSAVQAPSTATPPPVRAARPAARRTVRRVVGVDSVTGVDRSDMEPPWQGPDWVGSARTFLDSAVEGMVGE